MALRAGPVPNPILDKITPEHIDRLLTFEEHASEREHEKFKMRSEEKREAAKARADRQRLALEDKIQSSRNQANSLTLLAVMVLVLVFALCWLFLAYGQAQYIITVISALFAFAGGIGVGRWSAKTNATSTPQESPVQD